MTDTIQPPPELVEMERTFLKADERRYELRRKVQANPALANAYACLIDKESEICLRTALAMSDHPWYKQFRNPNDRAAAASYVYHAAVGDQ